MIEVPSHLYTQQADIARIEALIRQLPDEAHVQLHFTDGGTLAGIVATRPTLQVFRNMDGVEGFNAVVRIDDLSRQETAHYLWIDRIASVTALGSA